MWPQTAKNNDQAYIDPDFERLFRPAHLLGFNSLWELQFEDTHKVSFPESGSSLIDRFERAAANGTEAFYIKRQLNRTVRSWRRPFGEPTFALELRNVHLCEKHRIPTVDPVYYGERQMEAGQSAILIIRALDGYRSLQEIMVNWYGLERHIRESMLITVGKAIARIHSSGLSHSRLHCDDIILDLTQIPQWRLASPQYIASAKGRSTLLELQGFLADTTVIGDTELDCLLQAYLEVHPCAPSVAELKQSLYPSQQAS